MSSSHSHSPLRGDNSGVLTGYLDKKLDWTGAWKQRLALCPTDRGLDPRNSYRGVSTDGGYSNRRTLKQLTCCCRMLDACTHNIEPT